MKIKKNKQIEKKIIELATERLAEIFIMLADNKKIKNKNKKIYELPKINI